MDVRIIQEKNSTINYKFKNIRISQNLNKKFI